MRFNCCPPSRPRSVLRCLGGAVMIAAFLFLFGAVTMWLWNALVPHIFMGVRPIEYFEALGLLALTRILFGGFGCRPHRFGRDAKERWSALTPEERDHLQSRFCRRPGEAETPTDKPA